MRNLKTRSVSRGGGSSRKLSREVVDSEVGRGSIWYDSVRVHESFGCDGSNRVAFESCGEDGWLS